MKARMKDRGANLSVTGNDDDQKPPPDMDKKMNKRKGYQMGQKPAKSYYTDAMSNYLIIRCPPSALDGYQYRMLAVNRIQGLLPCSMRGIDGETYLYYEITSRQSLARRYDHDKISGREMKGILYSVCRVFRTLAEYLLDNTGILMDPEYIFYDYETEEFWFTYYPEKIDENGLQNFIEYLADRVDLSSAEATAVIYRLCDLSEQPGFILREELLDHEYEQISLKEGYRDCEQHDHDGLSPEKDPDLRIRGLKDQEIDDPEEDDLLWAEENESRKKPGKKKTGKDEKRKKKSKTDKRKSDGMTPGKILAIAILFLTLSAGLWLATKYIVMDSAQFMAARGGVIAGLAGALITAVLGLICIYKRNREDDLEEKKLREEDRRNAMMPSAEYSSGKT